MIEQHARDFIKERIAPETPRNDGKQTPWGGHPVFRGQHATATCCRTCLAKNHGIPATRAVSDDEQSFLVALLMTWIEGELVAAPTTQPPPKNPIEQCSLFAESDVHAYRPEINSAVTERLLE